MKLIIITIVLIATPLLAQELATTGTSSDNEDNMNCGSNEEFLTCGSPCVDTCFNKDSTRPCILICKSGCYCTKGFVRTGKGEAEGDLGPCVPISECDKIINN
ncbi:hypothetical protein DERF_013446 [Dermatophagoides farinae]|uniref:TIL domain-containing protein n=1 Tax=Dermatophagoides farinae TaxID=6954 RepID=A0A922HRK0_DERFA|nr:hypothetical protein DERF_013446 [Dermatophagoides farinae]